MALAEAPARQLELRPVTLAEARRFVAEHHRHNGPPIGWRFGVGLAEAGVLVGVAMAGRPVSRALDDGRTVEVLRVCTLGAPNASSRLYGAVCRAAAALGYRQAVTYTLASESGTSLLASGFRPDGLTRDRSWAAAGAASRPRHERNLWDEPVVPEGPKQRWRRSL